MATADISLLPRIIAARSGRMPRPVPQVPISKSTPPIMWDTFGGPPVPPGVAYPEIGMVSMDPYQVVPDGDVYEEQFPIPTGETRIVEPKGPSFMDRLKATVPRMIQGGIDAAATPNIAGGGPTDFFRSMQAAQAGAANRDLASYELERQRRLDAQQEELRQAQMAEYRAQAARNQALANQPPKEPNVVQVSPEVGQKYGILPDAQGRFMVPAAAFGAHMRAEATPDKTVPMVEVSPEVAQKYGVQPGPDGKFRIPYTAVGSHIRATAPPKPTGERAKVDLLKQGFIAQGLDETTAEEKALELYAGNYKAGTKQREASATASLASAGSSVAGAAETRRKTKEGNRKTGFQQLADAALAESRAGLIAGGNPNPTQQQIEDNAIANLSPEKVQYYVGHDPQVRVEAAAEITRRKKQQKTPKGILAQGAAAIGIGPGAPVPGPTKPTPPQYKAGDIVEKGGKKYKVVSVRPDGKIDAEPI